MKKIKITVSAAMITVLLFIGNLYSQAQWSTGGNNLTGVEWLGSDGSSSGPVEIKSLETGPGYNINFWTNGNHNMSLLPSGDLEVTNAANGFWINSNPVLWHNGNTSNIYVGVGAGNAAATGVNNTFVGFNAGNSNTTGFSNTFTGRDAGFSNTSGMWNTFNGDSTGYHNTTGRQNTFIGHVAGFSNTTGYKNNFVGDSAGFSNTTGVSNWFGGVRSGLSNTTGSWNTFTGHRSGESNTYGNVNCFYGKEAGVSNLHGGNNCFYGVLSGQQNTVGDYNCFYGNYSGQNNINGQRNVCVGHGSGSGLTTGNLNVIVGAQAGTSIGLVNADANNVIVGSFAGTTIQGNSNTIIGSNATAVNTNPISNAAAVGFSAVATNSNQMILGNNSVNVGIGLSSDITGPRSKLEINNGSAGSGLQFTQLTSGSTPFGANPGLGVLAVDADGVVIYVPEHTGTITACGTPAANRITKWCASGNEIENSIIFEDAATRIGIDIPTPDAKLHVLNTSEAVGGFFNSTFNGAGCISLAARAGDASVLNIGVFGQAAPIATPLNIPTVLGLSALNNNSGVWGQGAGSSYNFGGVFEANNCPNSIINIGVYGSASNCYSNTIPGIAGYFQGNVFANNALLTSDQMFKDSIAGISNALSIINSLQPKQFTFKTDSFPYMNFNGGKQYGFIAQQVDSVLPEIVSSIIQPAIVDTSGATLMATFSFKALHYTELIPLTIAAIQELDSIAATKAGVCDLAGSTPAHYLPKWDSVNRVLCHSIVHDNGTAVGIPAAQMGSYFTVSNSSDTVAAMFTSTNTGTVAVVKAVYNTNTSNTGTAAVYGYSNYSNGGDADGIGGKFTGGKYGVHGVADGGNYMEFGVMGEANSAAFMNVGVRGNSADTTDQFNVGVMGTAERAAYANVGLGGVAQYAGSSSVNIGVAGIAGGSQYENFGGNFEASDTVGLNYGVYAAVYDTSDYAGYFNGDVHIVGALTRGSDAKLKNNLQNIAADSSLAWLAKLEPKTYTYRREDYPSLTLPAGVQYGFTAQEVEKVLPHLVKDIIRPETRDLKGNITGQRVEYKGVDYLGFVPLLVGALKAQETKIEKQQTQIDSLKEVITDRLASIEQRLNGCCPTGASFKTEAPKSPEGDFAANNISVDLSNLQVIVLEQNVPNPFAEQTSISYYLPESVNHAQIVFTDVLGTVIKTADIKSGYGTVTVFAQNLSSGQYSYSLVVEGKVMESKKMVKQR